MISHHKQDLFNCQTKVQLPNKGTLSERESPVFSQMYEKEDGVVFLIKLASPSIDVSHICLFKH